MHFVNTSGLSGTIITVEVINEHIAVLIPELVTDHGLTQGIGILSLEWKYDKVHQMHVYAYCISCFVPVSECLRKI